ncbi:MAG: hypothetical protein H6Q18_28 [Bacteroidetes bacterium]|nr:hypothetical protein [Bacteroidota bacterium]
MKNTIIVFYFGLLLFSFQSCKEKENEMDQNFEIAETDLKQDFTKDKIVVEIQVKTNLSKSDWSVESNQDWCVVDKEVVSSSISKITLMVTASEEPNVRNAIIKVKSSVKNYEIAVNQLGYGPAILLKSLPSVIDSKGGSVNIIVTSNVEYTVTLPADANWISLPKSQGMKVFSDRTHTYIISPNYSYSKRQGTIVFTYVNDSKVTASVVIEQAAISSSVSDVVVGKDVKVIPTSGYTNDYQSNYGIEKTFDGVIDGENPYHSTWNQSAKFPVTLEYFFNGKSDIDYFIYYTRSGNGNFGEFDLYVATQDEPTYKLYGSYNFNMKNAASRVTFSTALKNVTKIKFSVKSGLNNFVSCDEMEFYRYNTDSSLNTTLLKVFKDITCSELQSGITLEQINTLPGYFATIATQLYYNSYDSWEKEFRIRNYYPYSSSEEWADKLMTKRYGILDNPTGIYANGGDSIVVLVGNTHGKTVSLQVIKDLEVSGDTYFLKEGVNKIGIKNTGMIFVMYTALPTTNPIKIHIPLGSGQVNGFFDLNEHKTDAKYSELLRKASYKYFCVRGNNIIFYFHRSKMLEYVPNNILSAINLWDDIVGWEQELMGIENVRPSQFNNHVFAISPETGYMWQSDYQIGFVYTYLNNILLYDNVMARKDNAWGPAHEIGHILQSAINWPGCTESSNNLFSNYILYKLNKYCSRGSELSKLAIARCVENQGFWNLGTIDMLTNEDAELHMRMNWQLWNYYHRCGYKTNFWQTLFKLLRENRLSYSDPGNAQLTFAKMASKAANEDLTEFFDRWGFFQAVSNTSIEQYGTFNLNITENMIQEAKNYMAQFPAPKHAFYYIEDRKANDIGIEDYKVGDVGYYTQFKDNIQIKKTITYIQSNQNIKVMNGDEAVAFEVKKDNKLLFFSNFFSFDVPSSISLTGASLYAVQADGKRILMTKL